MLRSILAVIAGFMVMSIFSRFGAVIAAGFLLRPTQSVETQQLSVSYLIVSLILILFAAIIGGWVAGAIAGRAPLLHAAILSSLGLIQSVVTILAAQHSPEMQVFPKWYQLATTILGTGGVLLGGVMRGGQQHA